MKTNKKCEVLFDCQLSIVNCQLTKDFSCSELVGSDTARQYGLENVPDKEAWENLLFLVCELLQPLRDLYGKPFRISSGFRSPELNRRVGGVISSQHLTGAAADCVVDDPAELLSILKESGLIFDQAILYKKRNFLHLSLRRTGGNRQQILYK